MTFLRRATLAVLCLVGLGACRSTEPIPRTPTHIAIVSGSNQSADPSTPLDSALVVQVLDGGQRPVAGVPLTWAATGGGTLSSTSTISDSAGKSSVTWTLGPGVATQVATVTSAQITGATVAFVATNGATIAGTIAIDGATPFGAGSSRLTNAGGAPRFSLAPPPPRRLSSDRIVVGFRSDVMHVAAAGSGVYRSISAARQTMAQLQTRVAAVMQARPLSHAELSPALLAARLRVDDTTQMAAVLASLRADPDVAWAERDEIVTIHDGAPHAMSADRLTGYASAFNLQSTAAASTTLPSDPFFFLQLWPATLLDLPKAWSITTGSANVVVAVVDMGVRFDHPDVGTVFTKDGYDFVSQIGYGDTEPICDGSSFTTIDGDGDGPDPDPTDPDDLEWTGTCWQHNTLGDHGLWTSSIIGASANNAEGLAGVNWNVRIRPVRVLGITGDGSEFDIAQGVLYAAGLPAMGANGALVQAPSAAPIINLSLGGTFDATVLSDAITAAQNAGSLIVASAGNDGVDSPTYPAAYPNVLAVSAVGQDGTIASYSNAGTYVSVAAPGGDFRIDDNLNGGGGVLGAGWDFLNKRPTYLLGFGTSGSAPYVSGIAALLLAKTPGLTAAELASRIEQYATRPAGTGRGDLLGWGIVDAYAALTQTAGPVRQVYARLVNATTGAVVRTVPADANGGFAFTKLTSGSYYVQAGQDEAQDTTIGVPGRRFGWVGGFGAPTVFNVNGQSQTASMLLGMPAEVEPNDNAASANLLTVGSYVVGSITPPDAQDVYEIVIPTAGTYTVATAGVVGTCGLGIELDTYITVGSAAGASIGSNDNTKDPNAPYCSRVTAAFTPGIYYVTVTGSNASGLATRGRYVLQVRAGS